MTNQVMTNQIHRLHHHLLGLSRSGEFEQIDALLTAPLQDQLSLYLVALLRETFDYRRSLKHWDSARNTVRDILTSRGIHVDQVLAGL